jgi:hypothetical protein
MCEEIRDDSWASTQHFNLNLENMHLPFVTNFGVEKANSDKLIILESDRILKLGYFAHVINQLEEGIQITNKRMSRPKEALSDQTLCRNIFDHDEEYRDEKAEPGKRNMWSGNTAVMKSDYERVGGMDEFYKGYGWADCDMTLTMEAAGVQSVFLEEFGEIHLWHEAMTYGEGDQKRMYVENGLHFCKKWNCSLPVWFREDVSKYRRSPL